MYTLIVILHVIVSVALILVILLQTGKGSDIGAVFGGGSSQTLFGSTGPTSFLSKLTAGAAIVDRIRAMLINEAVDALRLGVASAAAIDTAMVSGVNYPKGLLAWCDELGAAAVLATLERLHTEYGEERYRPSPLLRQAARDRRNFRS